MNENLKKRLRGIVGIVAMLGVTGLCGAAGRKYISSSYNADKCGCNYVSFRKMDVNGDGIRDFVGKCDYNHLHFFIGVEGSNKLPYAGGIILPRN